MVDVEVVEALLEALEIQADVGRRVVPAQLTLDSPCRGWSVRDVMGHSIGVTSKFTDFASGRTEHPHSLRGDLVGTDHRAALRAGATAAGAAWTEVDLNRRCHLSFGTFSARQVAGINLFDVMAHTWDIAFATDLVVDCPEDVWRAALDAALAVIGPARDLAHFALELTPPENASARVRFLNFLGRDDPRYP